MFDKSDLIFSYTDAMAVEDGMLVDLDQIFPRYKDKSLFKYATANLMSKGYIIRTDLKKAAIQDLMMQAQAIVKKQSDNYQDMDRLFKGTIELPSGEQEDIFIGQNESGRYTLMLCEDY